jgi:hypothetical protein
LACGDQFSFGLEFSIALLQQHIKFCVSMFQDFFEGNIASVERFQASFLFFVCIIGGNKTTISRWDFFGWVAAGVVDVLNESVILDGSGSNYQDVAVPTMDNWLPILFVEPNVDSLAYVVMYVPQALLPPRPYESCCGEMSHKGDVGA